MVEYTYEEALELLEKNLLNAKRNYDTYQNDLDFIKDQITILEVNFARIHNYHVAKQKENEKKTKA